MLNRQISAKKAWARLSERAESGEKFGFIACLGLLYKAGILTGAQVVEQLEASHISREDLAKFDAQRANSAESGQVRCAEWLGRVQEAGESPENHTSRDATASPAPCAREDVRLLPLRP